MRRGSPRLVVEGQWVWVGSGGQMTYPTQTFFHASQPDGGDCVSIGPSTAVWFDSLCTAVKPYVCEREW